MKCGSYSRTSPGMNIVACGEPETTVCWVLRFYHFRRGNFRSSVLRPIRKTTGARSYQCRSKGNGLTDPERRIAQAKRTRETALISIWRCCPKASVGLHTCGFFTATTIDSHNCRRAFAGSRNCKSLHSLATDRRICPRPSVSVQRCESLASMTTDSRKWPARAVAKASPP